MLFPLLSKSFFEKFIYIQYFRKRSFISFMIRLEKKKSWWFYCWRVHSGGSQAFSVKPSLLLCERGAWELLWTQKNNPQRTFPDGLCKLSVGIHNPSCQDWTYDFLQILCQCPEKYVATQKEHRVGCVKPGPVCFYFVYIYIFNSCPHSPQQFKELPNKTWRVCCCPKVISLSYCCYGLAIRQYDYSNSKY